MANEVSCDAKRQGNQELRLFYKPDLVRFLFIGEAPPSEDKFFYRANTHLYAKTLAAFRITLGPKVGEGKDFLAFFKSRHCYLDDLCLDPVPRDMQGRRCTRKAAVPTLAARVAHYKPELVIMVMKSISGLVGQAINMARVKTASEVHVLPFPVRQGAKEYVAQLARIIQRLGLDP